MKYLDPDGYCEENPEDFEIMFVLRKGKTSQDKIKSVQYTKQTGVIDVYYFDPLSGEDNEDDGILIGRITDDTSLLQLKALFDTILLPQFSINKSPPNGGMFYEYYVSKKDEDSKSDNNVAGN